MQMWACLATYILYSGNLALIPNPRSIDLLYYFVEVQVKFKNPYLGLTHPLYGDSLDAAISEFILSLARAELCPAFFFKDSLKNTT